MDLKTIFYLFQEKKCPMVFDALKYLNWNITEKYY